MSLAFLSPGRTVLLVADEALYIYVCNAKGPRVVEVVPWESENFEQSVAGIIARECGNKPVLILNDMVEQHYRKERIPRSGVGVMDKANMIKRKLSVAFPNYSVRAAFPLKEKVTAADKKVSDIYIFAAIPDTKQFGMTVAALNQSMASVVAFCLLPVEASDMVKTLATKLSKKGQPKPQWVVFIGQHRHGGLRQIVIKNGELALTRMTPSTGAGGDSQAWAAEARQEFNATMSYLSRFGFQQEDGLHVIAVNNSESGEALRSIIDETFTFSSLTVSEACSLLNLPFDNRQDDGHADLLHTVWSARKTKFILPMKSAQIDQVSKPRKIAMVASFILLCGILFLGYQLVNAASEISSANSELQEGQSRLAQLNLQYQKEVERKKALGFDVRLVQSSIAVYDAFDKNNIRPLMLYRDIGKALGKDMRVDKLTVKKPAAGPMNINLTPGGGAPPIYEATMQMTYPATSDIDKGNQEVRALQSRLQDILPDNNVNITKMLKDYEYSKGIVVQTGDLEKRNVDQDFVAEITIKGPPQK